MAMVLPQCVHWRASGCYCGLLSLLPKSAKDSLSVAVVSAGIL